MLLVIDIGNTNIKFGLFKQNELVMLARVSTDRSKTADEFAGEIYTLFDVYGFKAESVNGCIISSVVPPVLRCVQTAVRTLFAVVPLVVGPGIKTGLNIRIDNPSLTGADLVAGCVAAGAMYDCPCIVISVGTATTMTVLDSSRAMIGGAIIPGVGISLNALSEKCALLPSVGLEPPTRAIGKNTDECIRSGLVLGTASMIDGMIARFNAELGQTCCCVATGGLAADIIPSCSYDIILRDDLILQGLKNLYEKNTKYPI